MDADKSDESSEKDLKTYKVPVAFTFFGHFIDELKII